MTTAVGRAPSAILLVDHGSREPAANAVLDEIAALVRRRAPGWIVHVAHLELAPPGVADGLAACVAEGAAEIVVHPYFLAPGRHSARDVPALVDAARHRHPGVSIRLSEPLGVHEGLVAAILDRVGAAREP